MGLCRFIRARAAPAPRHLVDIINDHCLRSLGVLPDLANPKGYNDKVNWLKIHDQMPEQVICCDKLLARAYVAERIGRSCLLDIYQVARSVDRMVFESLPERYMLKANHDSGGVYPVTDRSSLRRAAKRIRRRIKRTFGVAQGEWAYAHISPYVFAEELMDGPITDYKFHCCSGQIRWVQIIADRASGKPRETNVDERYSTLPLYLDHTFLYAPEPPDQPTTWDQMKEIARSLSEPFRYVRVDLYEYGTRAIFGELTFWPKAGCYKSNDEPAFGQLLDIDTTFKRPMIHDLVLEESAIRQLYHRTKRKLSGNVRSAF